MRQRAKSVPTLYNKLDIKHKNLCIERRLLICPDKPQRVKTFCQHLREKCIFRHKPGTSWIQQCRHRNVIFTLIYLQTINKVFYCFSGNLLSSFYRHIQVYKSAVDDIAQFGQDCVDINTLFTVFYLRQGGRYTTTSVCLPVVLSVYMITAKVIRRFHWYLMLRLGLPIGKLINFRWWSYPGYGLQITVRTFLTIAE